MASFLDIKRQVMLVIPPDKRAQEETGVEVAIRAAIESLSKIYRWEWRERSTSIPVTSADNTYTMPQECDMISGKDGVLLNSDNNPTKNRVVMLTEYQFNQKYIENNGDDDAENTDTPLYYVPLVNLASVGGIQIRLFPAPDGDYTLKMYFFATPSDNDASNVVGSLIVHLVLSGLSRYIGEGVASMNFGLYRQLLEDLKPLDRKATSVVPLVTQNPYVRNHNIQMADKQSRR